MGENEVYSLLDSFYKNRINKYQKLKLEFKTCKESDENLYCDILLMFLYAQLEGYVFDILSYYIEVINSQNLALKDVKNEISAATKNSVFDSYEKHIADKSISKYSGRIKFITNIENFWDEKVNIPINIVNTKNNLTQKVFNDLMIKLGFSTQEFSKTGNILDNFVNRRNNIAHGNDKRTPMTYKEYEKYEELVIKNIMLKLKEMIVQAVIEKKYLK